MSYNLHIIFCRTLLSVTTHQWIYTIGILYGFAIQPLIITLLHRHYTIPTVVCLMLYTLSYLVMICLIFWSESSAGWKFSYLKILVLTVKTQKFSRIFKNTRVNFSSCEKWHHTVFSCFRHIATSHLSSYVLTMKEPRILILKLSQELSLVSSYAMLKPQDRVINRVSELQC